MDDDAPAFALKGRKLLPDMHGSATMRTLPNNLRWGLVTGRGNVWRRGKQVTTERDELTPNAVSQESKLPNANEAPRKYMLDEASQELFGTESHQSLFGPAV
jgi:hypothetical protein